MKTQNRGSHGQDTFYTKLPLRAIAERWTDDTVAEYPVQMMTLECGHSDFYRNQKSRATCPWCGQQSEEAK